MKRRFFDGLKGVFRIGRSATANETAASAEALEFKYTQQYFDYHRNMLLFFGSCILVTWVGLSLDVEKIAYISGEKEIFRHYLPLALFALGTYNGALFVPEWFDCAGPHWHKVQRVSSQLKEAVDALKEACEALRTSIPNQILHADSLRTNSSRERVAAMMREERDRHIQEIENLNKELHSSFAREMSEIRESIGLIPKGWKEPAGVSAYKRPEIYEFLDNLRKTHPNLGESDAESIHTEFYTYFSNYVHDVDSSSSAVISAVTRKAENLTRSYRSLTQKALKELEGKQDIHDLIDGYLISNRDFIFSLNEPLDKIRKIVKSTRRFARRSEAVPWIKVYFGGVIVPLLLLALAVCGVICHEVSYQKEISECEAARVCPSDLSLQEILYGERGALR